MRLLVPQSPAQPLLRTAAALALLGAFTSCGRPKPVSDIDAVGLDSAQRRLLFAQIVDDKAASEECAVVEGKPYKYFLTLCARIKEDRLKKSEDPEALYERLTAHPNLYRGHVVTRHRGVVIEVQKPEPAPDPALAGYTVVSALFVCRPSELFELRIVCPPGSALYQKLSQGIEERRNPVMRVSGYFMKCHAKRTNVAEEAPWQAPLLIVPEPSFSVHKYDAWQELVDSKTDKYLPSASVRCVPTEERRVVELVAASAGGQPAQCALRVNGQTIPLDAREMLSQALGVSDPDSLAKPIVLLRSRGTPVEGVAKALDSLKSLGLKRLHLKDENEFLVPEVK